MNQSAEELLPCPFCGGAATHTIVTGNSLWSVDIVPWGQVRCNSCEIGTDSICEGYRPSEVEAWNSRFASAEHFKHAARVVELELKVAKLAALLTSSQGEHPQGI